MIKIFILYNSFVSLNNLLSILAQTFISIGNGILSSGFRVVNIGFR